MAVTNTPESHGFIRLAELDAAHAMTTPGARHDALQRSARALADRIRALGPAVSVRTFDLITFPYPTAFAFAGAALSPAPFVTLTTRLQLVQVREHGRLLNVLVNPSDHDRALAAPFFAQRAKWIERYGEFVSKRLLSQRHGSVIEALFAWGVAPEDIDYITFNHLHAQDLRGLLGTEVPEPGKHAATRALLPNARLLIQVDELRTLACLHPLQAPWYVCDGLLAVPQHKIVALDGDYLIGPGLALVRTPGHSLGNHSMVIMTDRGIHTISENGVAVDSYAPEHSRIPGLRRYARERRVDVIMNANTREHSLAQYTSMMLEKTLADPCPDRPEFPQHVPSSELSRSALSPGLRPTYTHGPIKHGAVLRRTPSDSFRTGWGHDSPRIDGQPIGQPNR
jgi:hypothetical protein